MSILNRALNYNLKNAVHPNRLIGLWRLMSGFQPHYITANLSLGFAAIAKTGTYLLLQYFVDHFFMQNNARVQAWAVAFGFLLLAGLEGGFTYVSGRLAAQTAEGVARRLRNYLFDHIQHLSFTYHSQMETGELIQRCTSDVDALRRFFSDQAIGAGRVVLLFTVNFIAILQLNVRLALISVIVIPFVILISYLFFKKVSKAYEAYQEQDAILSTTLQENLSGVRVVKAFARQNYEIQKFEENNWEKFQRGKRLLTLHSLFWPISDTLCGIQMIAGFFTGAVMAINGEITPGAYLAYAGLVVWIIFPIRNLGRLVVQMSTGMVSYNRVCEIIREQREPLDAGDYQPAGNITGRLQFKDVCFRYEEGNIALENISFNCEPGQVIALLGSTGSGKTTLVNLLPRFYEYTAGSILLDGIDLKHYPRRYLRGQIGIVEQEPFLFSRTLLENITYGIRGEVSQEQIEVAAKAASILDVIQKFPKGFDTLVGEKGVTLSGGQKQRVAIARTLLKDPRILILDDSTSSVDTETESEIRQALQNLMRGRTTFVIAHRIQSLLSADLILVMDQGQIVQQGKHEELIQQEGIYRKVYDIQTRIEFELEKEIANVVTL
ncbi:MAG: ABC transporter ATP-binding protein [Anaerolineaceae bacterium]|nr:ABC transporter ATP-binding protein [Anaerolineaceae bacterium]